MKRSALLFYVALICVIIVLADLYLWFAVSAHNTTFEASKQEYLGHYPAPLQNARMITVVSILLLAFSGFVFLKYPKSERLRIFAVILGFISVILIIWKIFSLM